jgi:hypothetical protein
VEKGCPQKSLIFSSPRHHRSSGRRLLFCLPIVPDVRLLPQLIVDCYCCFVGGRKNLLAPAGTSRFIRLSLLIQSIAINTLTGPCHSLPFIIATSPSSESSLFYKTLRSSFAELP